MASLEFYVFKNFVGIEFLQGSGKAGSVITCTLFCYKKSLDAVNVH